MMSRSLLLPLALLVSAPVLAEAPAAAPSTREVADFRGVSVGHGLRAEVKRGTKEVRLEGSAEDVARVKLEVKDGILTTDVNDGSSWFNRGLKNVRLIITNPRVESVEASGGARVEAEATATDTFRAEASGGSELKLSGVDTQKLTAEASGGARLTLEGHAAQGELEGSGGSSIHAQQLQLGSLQVDASGGTQIEASPKQLLRGELSGGSTLTSSSKPENVQVESSGGSRVRYE